jgi:GntR family transcriptional regulator/MocR family aminotransferase
MGRRSANPAAETAASAAASAPPKRLQVYQQLRAAIEAGGLRPGSRLPPSRVHAATLGVARNTVLWALSRLVAEGYVQARVGDGSYVAADLAPLRGGRPGAATTPARSGLSPAALGSRLSARGRLIADTALAWQPPQQPALPFRIGAPEVASFPFALWDRLQRSAPRQPQAQYLDPAGLPALREAVAQWLWASRGIRCSAAQVVVCAGSQQALDLIARLLLAPGDAVLVEDPGYPGIRACLQAQGAQVRPVPVDAEGLAIDTLAGTAARARLAVVTPTHQYPLGVHMSLARRLALIRWARTHDAWLVEDDYDGEFQYGTHRIPALTSLPHGERVLYVGTFSKTLHPGLRLGFIVAPEGLAPALATAKALSDRHSPGDAQATLARFIGDGHLLRHLNRMRALYAQRQAVLIDALAAATGGALQLAPSAHGMHLVHERLDGGSDLALSGAAAQAGLQLAPLSRYSLTSSRSGWVFGYAAYDDAALREAARRLGPLWRRDAAASAKGIKPPASPPRAARPAANRPA